MLITYVIALPIQQMCRGSCVTNGCVRTNRNRKTYVVVYKSHGNGMTVFPKLLGRLPVVHTL